MSAIFWDVAPTNVSDLRTASVFMVEECAEVAGYLAPPLDYLAVVYLIEALCYKPEGHGFESQ
jgi:hypothetical protein